MLFGNNFGSYVMDKIHSENGSDYNAALLLVRLSKVLSRFPLHKASILASRVISYQKAGSQIGSGTG